MSPAASFVLGIHFVNSYFVIRVAHLARSIIKTHVGKVQTAFSENFLNFGLKEGIKAVRLLQI